MNNELVFWDGTYCMVCQTNYGTPENTEVTNFLCRRCNEYAERNALIRRIDLFEEQNAKYRHPANAGIEPGTITYETLDIEFRDSSYSEDDSNPVPCSNCNREGSVGMWLLEVERNGYNEIISGPLCSSCYVDMSHDYYGGNEVS